MNNLPQDPNILLSFVNMKLRDDYSSIDELCNVLDIDRTELEDKLRDAGFTYDAANNHFV